jgi:hypothetical protein
MKLVVGVNGVELSAMTSPPFVALSTRKKYRF